MGFIERPMRKADYPTLGEVQAYLPDAAVESTCSGEVVIYTGWSVNSEDEDGPLVGFCEECESGDDVPEEGCTFCGRTGAGGSES